MRHFGGGVGHLHSSLSPSRSSNDHRDVPMAMSDPANSSSPEDLDGDNSDMGELQHEVASGDRDNQDETSDVSSSEPESDDSSESTSGEDPDSRSDDDGIDFDSDDNGYDSF